MDPGKRKTLIEWVNSLAVAECIESLDQLKDGRHLLALANLVEGIPQQSDIETQEKRWDLIFSYLEGLYQCPMNTKVEKKAILKESHEFEIAKATLLLMSAAMLCERNSVFVERAMQMEVSLQHEIRDMVEWVIQPNQNLADLDPCYHQVLSKPLELCLVDMKNLNPQASSTPQSCAQRSRCPGRAAATPDLVLRGPKDSVGHTPVFSTSILGRFTSPGPSSMMSPMSPVQQMVQSPNMANKIRIQQKEQKIKLLERDLNTKRHLLGEYEAEMEDARKELDNKDKTLATTNEQLHEAMRRLRQMERELEDLRDSQDMEAQELPDVQRIHQLRREVSSLTERNKQLEQENTELFSQVHPLQDQVGQMEKLREQLRGYQTRLRDTERELCELRAAVSEKTQQVGRLSEVSEQAHSELMALRQLHHQQVGALQAQLDGATSFGGGGESLGGVMEIKFKEELDALKTEISEYDQKLQEKANYVLELLSSQDQLTNEKSELTYNNGQLSHQVEELTKVLEKTQLDLSQSMEMSGLWEQKAHELEATLGEVQNTSRAHIAELEAEIAAEQTDKQRQLAAAQEAINNLQTAMDSAQAAFAQEKESLCNQIQTSEGKVEQLLNDLKNEGEKNSGLSEQLGVKEVEVQELTTNLSATQQQLTFVQESMNTQLQQKDSHIQDMEKNLTSKLEEFEHATEALKKEILDKESQLNTKHEHLQSVVDKLESTNAELNNAQQELTQVQETMTQQIHQKNVCIQDIEATLSSKVEELHQTTEALQREIMEKENQVKTQQDGLQSVEGKLESTQTELDNTQHQLAMAQESMTQQLQQKDAHIHDIETTLSSKVEEFQLTTESFKKEIEERETQLKTQQEHIQSVEEKLVSTQSDLSSQLQQKDATLSNLTEELQNTKMESSSIQDQLNEQKLQLESGLASAQQDLSEAESKCSKLEEVLKQHEVAAEDNKRELARQLEMATMSGDEQREMGQKISLQLSEVSTKYEESQRVLEALAKEQAEKEEQWHVKVDEFEKAAGEIGILRQQQQETEVELRTVGSQLDQALTQLEETKTTRDAFMVRVQEQEANLIELNERLLESETQLEEEKTKSVNLERDLKATKEKMSHMRQELDAECERVEAMETELMETQQTAENQEAELTAKLEEAWLARESLENEMSAVRSKTRVMEDQGELLHQKLCQMAECLKQSKEESQQRVEGLQKKLSMVEENRKLVIEELDDAQFRITTLQEELQESRENTDSLECSILHHQNHGETIEARLKEFMEEKEGETGTLVTELTDTDNKLKEARAQVAEKLAELTAVNEQLDQLRQQSSHIETTLSSQLEATQANIQTLQQQLEAEAAKVASTTEALQVAQEALFSTEQQKEQAEQSLIQSRMSLSGKEDHLGSLQEKAAMLKRELEASNERVQELQDTVSIYEQKSSDLQKQHQDAEAEAERKEMKLEADIERLEEENEEVSNKLASLEREKQVLLEKLNQEELTVKEARMNAVSLEQELSTTRRELSMRQEALQNMEVQGMNQIGNLEKVLNETSAKSNAICIEYEQKIAHLKQEAIAVCQKYESQIQELHSTLQQTKCVVEEREKSHQQEITKLTREQKEEVKVLARQIESLTTELQNLKCWELSERASLKELEEKCANLEKKLSESHHEKMVLSLKAQSTEKRLEEIEGEMTVSQLETELRSELEEMKFQLLEAKRQYTEELEKLSQERAELESQNQETIEELNEARLELKEAHDRLDAANQHHEEELFQLGERCKHMEGFMEKRVKQSSEASNKEQKLVHKHEEELAHLRDEHFANMAEIEMNYTLEIERLESELQAIKKDATHQQELLAAVEAKAAAAQNDAHAELLGLEKDKLDLESQLESRDRQLKAVKVDADRALRQKLSGNEQEKAELYQKNQKMEREMHRLMEREKRYLAAHRHEMSLGADMNAKLQQQGAEKEVELRATQERYQQEITELAAQLNAMQEKYTDELELLEGKNNDILDEQISTWRSKFEQLTVAFNKLEDRHAKSEAERQRLEINIREVEAGKAAVQERETELAETVREVTAQRDLCEEQLQEASNLKNQVREEEMLNKRLGNQVRSLEAQLDHASRQLKAEGRPRTLVPPPQPPPFPETPASLRRSMRLAKENTPEAKGSGKAAKPSPTTSNMSPKSCSDDEFAKPYDLRSAKNSEGVLSLKDLTVTPGTEGRYLSRLSISNSFGPTPKRSRSSLSSYSDARDSAKSDRSQRSEQARSMRLSISSTSSHESTRSANVPFGTGALFSMEDEPVEFEWDRLSELQRRNTLCLPHLKSSYPTEVQTVKPKKMSEMDLQTGEPLNESQDEGMETRTRKRTSTDRLNDDTHRRKTFTPGMFRPGTTSTSTLNGSSGVTLKVYPHYSPRAGGTPKHKLARTSPRGTPTSATKKKRGEERHTPKTDTPKRNTPKVKTPKQKTPKKPRGRFGSTPKLKFATPKPKKENSDPKAKSTKTPMSFNIGFTPKKSRRLTQLLRKKKPSSDETPKVKGKKPLGDHNRP